MYERILVALDGGEASNRALQHAVALARVHRSALRLVHVVDELGVKLGPTYTPDEFWNAAHVAGEHLLRQAVAVATQAGVDVEAKVIENRTFGAIVRRVAERIAEEALRWPADLVVVGTRGRRGLTKIVLGSVAEGVLRASPVPVLLIRGAEASAQRRPRRRAAA